MLVQQIASGGDRPISLTVHGNLLYALNYDRLAATPDAGNITGFRIRGHGRLAPLAASTQSLGAAGANPGQVAFSPDGRSLAVTEKATDQIVTYAVSRKGVAGPPAATPSGGDFPFSLAFARHGVLVEADDFQDLPGRGAASSYVVSSGGALRLVSGAVPDLQDGACWVVAARKGTVAYVSNTNNAVVSAYRVAADGTLSLLDPSGVAATTGGVKPRDLALGADGHFLYDLNSASGTVAAFAINRDGSLESLGVTGAIPAGIERAGRTVRTSVGGVGLRAIVVFGLGGMSIPRPVSEDAVRRSRVPLPLPLSPEVTTPAGPSPADYFPNAYSWITPPRWPGKTVLAPPGLPRS